MYGNNRRDILYGYRYGYSIIPCSIDIMGIYGNIWEYMGIYCMGIGQN